MAFDLESSSPPDTGKGKELKTGNLKRSYNMPKGGKLSYKSIVACYESSKTDSDRTACKKYFDKKHGKKESLYTSKKKSRPSNIGKGTSKNIQELMDNRMKMGSDPALKKKKKKGK